MAESELVGAKEEIDEFEANLQHTYTEPPVTQPEF
jgi:hypothetical protein